MKEGGESWSCLLGLEVAAKKSACLPVCVLNHRAESPWDWAGEKFTSCSRNRDPIELLERRLRLARVGTHRAL